MSEKPNTAAADQDSPQAENGAQSTAKDPNARVQWNPYALMGSPTSTGTATDIWLGTGYGSATGFGTGNGGTGSGGTGTPNDDT